MASIIKTLLQQYKEELRKQDQFRQTSPFYKLQYARHQKFGNLFLDLIVEMLVESQELEAMNEVRLRKRKDFLLEKIKAKHQTPFQYIERTLGIYIQDSFDKNKQWSNLKQECEIALEDYESNDEEDYNDEDDDLKTEISESVYMEMRSNPLSSIKGTDNKSEFSLIDRWNSQIDFGQNEDTTQVEAYLNSLNGPQSQLNLLCQHFRWSSSFVGKSAAEGQFEVTSIVNFEYKNLKEELRETAIAPNKKLGRMLSSFKMIRKIYISFPQIWRIFNTLRSDKSMSITGSNINVTRSILNTTFEHEKAVRIINVEAQIHNAREKQQQLSAYLSEIANFKSEMNILTQQIPQTFVFPKPQKMQHIGQWKVKGVLEYKDSKGINNKRYEEVQVSANSKTAEEQVAKKLLTAMYKQHSEILEIMQVIKKKKGIRT